MAAPRPLEQSILDKTEGLLARFVVASSAPAVARLEILEAAASIAGGWSLQEFRRRRSDEYGIDPDLAEHIAAGIIKAIDQTTIPIPLALSSLARPDMEATDRRQAGVYYTDFRLAQYVAHGLIRPLGKKDLVIDPAAGTGILLAAAGLVAAKFSRSRASHFVERQACAADLDAKALRGTRLALGSMTDSLDAIDGLDQRLRTHDSLLAGLDAWSDVAPSGFDLVVGNPPWEKLKASRHEYLRSNGSNRHYGDDTVADEGMSLGVGRARDAMAAYTGVLATRFREHTHGEPDLYKAFMALAFEIMRPGGQLGLLVPAGLIRSSGTRALRDMLLKNSSDLRVTVLDNRARFFAIDTRFKFLTVHAAASSGRRLEPLQLTHGSGTDCGVLAGKTVSVGRRALERMRPDLTVPEVRSAREWQLFAKMHRAGPALGSSESWWSPSLMREVDMTKDRGHFSRFPQHDELPVVEGRMVHQFRTGAKAYQSGTGRRAAWLVQAPGESELVPQFWIPRSALSPGALQRSTVARVGFCDITGQTNERSMLASLIPAGVACGNKVPTMTFTGSMGAQEDSAFLWLAVANSFSFDWLLRRTITTTVNYFLLLSMPMPRELTTRSLAGRRLIRLSRMLMAADTAGSSYNAQTVATMRAEIDAIVAVAYGLTASDLRIVLNDFPLLDRGQPPLPGESQSTVTADLVMAKAGSLMGQGLPTAEARSTAAIGNGAVSYVPADYSDMREFSGSQSAAVGT